MNEQRSRNENEDVESFLNEMSIRERLIMTDTSSNTDQNIEADISMVSLHNSADEPTSTSFKCTMKIIMMPYVVNNKIIKLHSFQ